jgi:hypothetical protein
VKNGISKKVGPPQQVSDILSDILSAIVTLDSQEPKTGALTSSKI